MCIDQNKEYLKIIGSIEKTSIAHSVDQYEGANGRVLSASIVP